MNLGTHQNAHSQFNTQNVLLGNTDEIFYHCVLEIFLKKYQRMYKEVTAAETVAEKEQPQKMRWLYHNKYIFVF